MSDTPRRIQLKRTKGWRMPDGSAKVDRSTKWGNPFRVAETSHGWFVWGPMNSGPYPTELHATKVAVAEFRFSLRGGELPFSIHDARSELAGKNLACWCPPDAPCHADVLIEIANRPETS